MPPWGILKVHAQPYSPSSLPNCTTLAHEINAETILPSNAPLHQKKKTQRVQRRVQFSDNATNIITPIIAQSRDEDEIQVDRRPRLAQGNKIDAVIYHPDILSWSFRESRRACRQKYKTDREERKLEMWRRYLEEREILEGGLGAMEKPLKMTLEMVKEDDGCDVINQQDLDVNALTIEVLRIKSLPTWLRSWEGNSLATLTEYLLNI